METILYVCGCLALICLAALFFYLIRFFSSAKILVDKSSNTMEQLVEEIKIVRVEAKETLDNLDVLMQNLIPTIENLNISMVKVNQQLDSVEVITQRAKKGFTDRTEKHFRVCHEKINYSQLEKKG